MSLLDKYSQKFSSPYLVWVFMWVNAIKDCALFVDWPDCIFYKADMLFKTHDLFSLLKKESIDTKLFFSWVMPNKMIKGYDEQIKRKLFFIEKNDHFSLWIITSMPVTWLLAIQYENITSQFNKKYINISSYIDKFWLDWYAEFLKELAKNLDFDIQTKKEKYSISIIGNLYDRNEWDCIWNVKEIKRILFWIWVKVNSIWLEWKNYKNLLNVKKSNLLVSFPYWEKATKILSKRLWVDYIELDVPFGLKSSINFVNEIWKKLGIDEQKTKTFLSKEILTIKQKTDLLNQSIFLNKSYIYAWDPYLENWINDIWEFLWMDFVLSIPYNWKTTTNFKNIDTKNLDLVIWNSDFYIDSQKFKKLEFSYPSYNIHFLLNRPYFWFKWMIFFIERLYEKLSKNEKIIY